MKIVVWAPLFVVASHVTTVNAFSPHIKIPKIPSISTSPIFLGSGKGKTLLYTGAAEDSQSQHDQCVPKLLEQSTRLSILTIAGPAILIGCLRNLYGITDAYWIGRLGAVEVEAMGAASFAGWMVLIMGELAAVGVHAMASGQEGANRRDLVGKTVVQGLWASIAISVIVAAAIPLCDPYFAMLGLGDAGPAAAIRSVGRDYLRWLCSGAFPLIASGVAAAGFKGIGQMGAPLLVTAGSVAFNSILDPILIWGIPGFIPAMGVAGAAIATNVSSALALVLLLLLLNRNRVPIRWAPPSAPTLRRIASIGSPMALSGMLYSAVYIALGRIITAIPGGSLGALGIGHRLENIAFTINEAFAVAAATLVGQWLGCGSRLEARRVAAHAVRLCIYSTTPLALAAFFFARPLVALFTSDPAVARAAVSYLRIVAVVFPVSAVETTYEGALTGAADTLPTLVCGLVLNTSRIPLAFLFSRRWGLDGIWVAISLTTVVKALVIRWSFIRSRFLACSASDDGEDEECVTVFA